MVAATYFITVPFIVTAAVALLSFREPRLHRDEAAERLRQQVAATYRAVLDRGAVRPIVALLVLSASRPAVIRGVLDVDAGRPPSRRWSDQGRLPYPSASMIFPSRTRMRFTPR